VTQATLVTLATLDKTVTQATLDTLESLATLATLDKTVTQATLATLESQAILVKMVIQLLRQFGI
jgi:hypothetical protein